MYHSHFFLCLHLRLTKTFVDALRLIIERTRSQRRPTEFVLSTLNALYVRCCALFWGRIGVGDAHFVAVPSSAKVPPATVTAEHLVESSLNDEAFTQAIAKRGSFPVRASERSAYVIDGLDAGEAYDVFFVVEVG